MNLEAFVAARAAELLALLSDRSQWLALAAALVAGVLILVSAFVKTIVPLRWLAVGSNLGFIVYGYAHPAPMVLVLHLALLPINLWRVLEMMRLTRRVQASEAAAAGLEVWLQPFMKRQRLRAGTVLFSQGDLADRLYVLAEGRLEVLGTDRFIEAGQMFGEIAFFSPEHRRTHGVRCAQDATLLSIDELTFRQLFFQNPAFGLEITRLVAARLSADVQRLEQDAATRAAARSDVDATLTSVR
ncbi:MAG: cyclic nucleotide-binding domain-containing protein [Rubrivivax sp.]|nr:cyclic nucleotide-binding domain-containing protein [Rubrivivax sp.]